MITTAERKLVLRPNQDNFRPDKTFQSKEDTHECTMYILNSVKDEKTGKEVYGQFYPNGVNHIQIITHNDMDGYGAAAMVIQNITKSGMVSPDVIHVEHRDYSDSPHIDEKANMVFITDYSITKQTAELIQDIVKAVKANIPVFWFDHHASSIEMLKSLDPTSEEAQILQTLPGIRDVAFCATKLVWAYYNPNAPVPVAIEYLDDYDSFKLKYPESMWLNYAFYSVNGLMNIDPKSSDWANLVNGFSESWYRMNDPAHSSEKASLQLLNQMLEYGKKYEEIIIDHNERILKTNAFIAQIRGLDGVEAIFLGTADVGSMSFGKYLRNDQNPEGQYDRAIAMRIMGDTIECSIYSADDAKPNAKEVAEKFGGGGHPGAAGFTIKRSGAFNDYTLPFINHTIRPLVDSGESKVSVMKVVRSVFTKD